MRNITLNDEEVTALRDAVGSAVSSIYGDLLTYRKDSQKPDDVADRVASKLSHRIKVLKAILAEVDAPKEAGLEVVAYVPQGEKHAILSTAINGVGVGFAFRRGERGYDLLLTSCNGQPKWIFGQQPSPLA